MTALLGFIPGPTLRLFGMRRSGNHAIADWLMRNAPDGRSVFLNNCRPAKDPLVGFRTLAVNGKRRPARLAHRDLAAQTRDAEDGALLVISYEDLLPKGVVDSLPCTDVLIFRSFLNWSASLLKKVQDNPAYSSSRRASIVLRAFDTYARLLVLAEESDTGTKAICYDDWVVSDPARQDVLASLGLPLRDTDLGAVQNYGGGSSFQKDATAATDLKTDQRWKQMASDADYIDILQLAARDKALMAAIVCRFPEDADRIADLTGHRI